MPDLGDDGTVQGVYALVNDVTDLARTVEELRASEGRLRRIVGAIPDTTLRLSSDGSILDFASTTDDDAQQFVGSNVSVLVRNKDLGDVMTCISRAIATGEIQRQDLRAFEGGELRHFECRSARVNEQEVFVIVRDVTDIRQLEDDLRALNQQLEERVEDRTAALERESASRRDTSQALRERAEELDRVLRNAKCIFWRSTIVENENGRLIWTPTRTDDPVYRAVLPLNIPPGRTYIEAWRDAIAPADRDAMDRTGNDAIREGRDQYQQAFTCTDAHGRPRRIQEDVSIKRTGPGRWEAAGVARDVTSLTDAEAVQQQLEERIADRAAALAREVAARRDASEALRARAEELDRVLRDAKCILWRSEVVQGDDGTLNWTPKRMDAPNFLAVLPLAVKRGQTHLEAWGEAVMPADRRRLNRIRTDAVLEGRDRYQYEYGCVVESGEVRRMHEDVSVRRIGPRRWEAVGVARDVTSFAAAEAIQHELEQRFRAVFDNSPVGMLIRNRNLVVTHANKALCDMLGYTLEELRELDIAAIADPEEHTTDNRRLSVELLEGVRDSYEVERRHLRKNGESFWVRLRVYAVRDDNGEFVYTVAMQEDISDRKAAEAAIQAHEHERTQLLQRIVDVQEEERARISFELHDQIGQQLTSLLLGLRAAEAATDLTVMKQQTAELRTETTEAVEAVRQMAFDMRPGTLDDLGVVTALRRDVENIARSAGFHAVFRVYDEDRLRLSSDAEVALYRVVNAALTNIVQHARASNVSVILQPQDTDALVMVEDDGVGFDTEAAMAGPVEARFGLLGMQERMASVGGRVNVESTPGEGTATFITLPLEPEG